MHINMEMVVAPIVVGIIGWQIRDFFVGQRKERELLQKQEYLNRNIEDSIKEIKCEIKEIKNWKYSHTDDSATIRQQIFDGIKDLKHMMELVHTDIQNVLKDHEKRLEAIERCLNK